MGHEHRDNLERQLVRDERMACGLIVAIAVVYIGVALSLVCGVM